MTDIFYWTGLATIFAIAIIAGQLAKLEQPINAASIKSQEPVN